MSILADFGALRVVTTPLKAGAAALAPGVVRVEMNTGAKGRTKYNLMDDAFFRSVRSAFDFVTYEMGDAARCAVLHAGPIADADPKSGSHFSAGLDLLSVQGMLFKDVSYVDKAKLAAAVMTKKTSPPPMIKGSQLTAARNMELRQMIARWQDSFSAIARCRVPVIAAMTGTSFGGALDMASSCDFRYGSASTLKMSIREVRVGITADLSTLQRTPGIVGQGILREWAYTGRIITPDEGLRVGYLNAVLPDDAATIQHALDTATVIATECSPIAVQGTKETLNHDCEHDIQRNLEAVRTHNAAFIISEDMVTAALHFATRQKTPPKFTAFCVPQSELPVASKDAASSMDTAALEKACDAASAQAAAVNAEIKAADAAMAGKKKSE
jgi:enoyl-CoA hydratase/carnithine racemase